MKIPSLNLSIVVKLRNCSYPSKGALQKPGEDRQDIDGLDEISTIVNDHLVHFRNVNLRFVLSGVIKLPTLRFEGFPLE